MSLTFEEMNERATTVKKNGKRVGVITDTPNGFGYRVFGSPVAGSLSGSGLPGRPPICTGVAEPRLVAGAMAAI